MDASFLLFHYPSGGGGVGSGEAEEVGAGRQGGEVEGLHIILAQELTAGEVVDPHVVDLLAEVQLPCGGIGIEAHRPLSVVYIIDTLVVAEGEDEGDGAVAALAIFKNLVVGAGGVVDGAVPFIGCGLRGDDEGVADGGMAHDEAEAHDAVSRV